MLYGLLAFVVLLFLYMYLEAGWLEACRHTQGAGDGLRVAILSDLHISHCRVPAHKVRALLEAEAPDLLLFLGDAVDNPSQIPKAAAWLASCAKGIPAYAVPGNHDHRFFERMPDQLAVYREALRQAGFLLTVNETRVIMVNGHSLRLTALDDDRYGKQETPVIAETEPPRPYHLVMTHNPQRLTALPEGYADFAVAGHFHGGQIWMPFGLEFRLFRKEPLGREGVRRGLHVVRGFPVWLTRGIGNVLFPLRLGARPDITFLTLPGSPEAALPTGAEDLSIADATH